MQFNETLFPEIVLDKRGEKFVRETYKKLFDLVNIEEAGTVVHDQKLKSLFDTDVNFFRHVFTSKLCKITNFKTYHVGGGFLGALSSLERDIPIDMLPEEFSGYINFAKNQMSDDDGFIEGAFVYIGKRGSEIFKRHNLNGKRCLFITYVNNYIPGLGYKSGNLAICLEQFDKISEALTTYSAVDSLFNSQWKVDNEIALLRNKIYRTVINTVLYIHSEDPKIERVNPYIKGGKISKNQIRNSNGVINECSIPITFVHRLYEKQRVYNVDETFVESYPRWQRCGEGLTRIKLVWVKEHTRHYTKNEINGIEVT